MTNESILEAEYEPEEEQTITAQKQQTEQQEPEQKPVEVQQLDDNRLQVGEERYITERALREEREEARRLREQVGSMQNQLGELSRLKEEIQADRQRRQEEAQVAADEQDPYGAVQRRLSTLEEREQTRAQVGEQQTRQQEQWNKFTQALNSKVGEFRQGHTDYDDALAFVQKSRDAELQALGFVNPAERQSIINQEELALAASSMQRNANPAELVYNLAKHRGWKPGETSKGNGAADSELDRLEKGMAASRTLSGSGRPEETSSADRLLDDDVSDEEFDKLWDERFGS